MAEASFARLSKASAEDLSPVVERLRQAQWHYWTGSALLAAGTAAVVATAVYILAHLALPATAFASGHWRTAAIAGTVGAIVLLVASIASRRQSLEDLARTADRVLGTQERISTACEVAARSRPSPVERALLADVVSRAMLVDPFRLAPIPWRSSSVLVLISLLAAWAAFNLLPETPAPSAIPAAVEIDRPLDQLERTQVAERLTTAMDLVSRDAALLGDPYLGAVGRELERVAAELASGEIATRERARDELNRLSAYAADGYARATGKPGGAEAVARSLGEAMAALESPGARDQEDLQGAAPSVTDGAQVQPSPEGIAGLPESSFPREDGGFGAGVSTVSQSRTSRSLASGEGEARLYQEGDCLHDGDLDCFLISEPTNAPSVLLERRGDQAAQGQPNAAGEGAPPTAGFRLGASSRSGAGESFEAGRGVATIGDGQAADPGAFAAGDEVGLSAGRRAGERNTIRMDRAPESDAGSPADEDAAAAGLAWRRLEEGPVSRNRTTPGQRDAIARYFQPDAD